MAADGTQQGFGFRPLPNSRLRPGEIVVDLFAGGGGASEARPCAISGKRAVTWRAVPVQMEMVA